MTEPFLTPDLQERIAQARQLRSQALAGQGEAPRQTQGTAVPFAPRGQRAIPQQDQIEGFQPLNARSEAGGLEGLGQNIIADWNDTVDGYKALGRYIAEQGPGALVDVAQQLPAAFVQSYTRWIDAAKQGRFAEMVYQNPVQFLQDWSLPATVLLSGGTSAAAKAFGTGSALTRALKVGVVASEAVEFMSDPVGGAGSIAARRAIGGALKAALDRPKLTPTPQEMPIDVDPEVGKASAWEGLKKTKEKAFQAIVDENEPVRQLARRTSGTVDSTLENRVRTLPGLDEKINATLDRGFTEPGDVTKPIDRDLGGLGNFDPEWRGGMTQIWEELGQDNAAAFRDYAVARRVAKDLARQGKTQGFDIPKAAGVVAKYENDPVIHGAWKKMRQFHEDRLNYWVRSGMASQDQINQWRFANPNYVPFQRSNKVQVPVDAETARALGIEGRSVTVDVDEASRIKSMSAGGRSISPPKQVVKKLEGSLRMVADPFTSDAVLTARMMREAELNQVFQETAKLADVEGSGVRIVEDTPISKQPSMDELSRSLDGEEVRAALERGEDPMVDINSALSRPEGLKQNQAVYFENGERKVLEFEDPDVADAMAKVRYNLKARIDEWADRAILGLPKLAAKVQRAGITTEPGFMLLTNAMRDQWQAMWTSRYNFVPVASVVRSVLDRAGRAEVADLWARSGGMQAHLAALDKDVMQRKLAQYMAPQNAGYLAKMKDKVKHPLQVIQDIREGSESITRLTEFHLGVAKELGWKRGQEPLQAAIDRARKQGIDVDDRLRSAAVSSRDVSVDFAMKPGYAGMRALNATTAFLNANNQGKRLLLDRLANGTPRQQAQAAMKMALGYTLPAMAVTASNWNDPEYWDIPEFERQMFMHFKPSNLGVPENLPGATTMWRYPIPHELGLLGFTLPKTIAESYMADDPEAARRLMMQFGLGEPGQGAGGDPKALSKLVNTQLNPMNADFYSQSMFNPFGIPTLLKPGIENVMNRSFYFDAPLEPVTTQRLEKSQRAISSTSELARSLAGMMDWGGGGAASPIQIDNLINGLTGTLGRGASQALNPVIRAARGDTTEAPDAKGTNMPVINRLVANPSGRSQAREDFFDILGTLERRYNTAIYDDFRGDRRTYLREHKSEIALHRAFRDISSSVFEVFKAQRAIRLASNLSGAEKRKRIDELDRRVNTMMRSVVGKYRAFEREGGFAD